MLNIIADKIKRRLLFWKYDAINLHMSDEEYAFLETKAKELKITVDKLVENILRKRLEENNGNN